MPESEATKTRWPFPRSLHRRSHRLRQQHRRLEVDPQRPLHLLGAEVLHQAGAGQAGVGDQDVDVGCVGGELLGGAGLGQVRGRRPMAFPWQLGGEALQLLGLAGAEDQHGAALGEGLGDRPPEAAGGAGQKHAAAREVHASEPTTGRGREPAGHSRDRVATPMRLYVCWGTMATPRPGGHPCSNAHKALTAAGHDPEVIKVRGLGVGPIKLWTDGRREVEKLTGQPVVPVLVTDEGETVSDSKRIIAWAKEHPAGARTAT